MAHSTLDSKKIIDTIGQLKLRIDERFPSSGIGTVCDELRGIAKEANETVESIQKTHIGYRILVFLFVFILIFIAYIGLGKFRADESDVTVFDMVQVLDAAFNVILLIGGAILFLVSIENRAKRSKTIQAVNKLRCIAHVIDSHQLTKDPCYAESNATRTVHSPTRNMDSFQLGRYLDYCTEMLSLVSKIAFLYVQDYHDPIATNAVNDLDDLTNGLSRKIWQKIMTIKNESAKVL
ncbi:MAG: hypothetical protein JEZ07_07855 [Phycisphaerae bacterium]|nr:hypothetical protein [Phycisphaerae bacterium]